MGFTQTLQLSRARTLFAWAAAALLFCPTVSAQAPRLTVWIVADQFRADYLQRYANDLATGGLRRMQTEGADFPRMRFGYGATFTASGAATLATGSYPDKHGIVANSWYDGNLGEVIDSLGSLELPTPTALHGSTVADELNLATSARARVVSIADDPRLAVFLAGHRPSACIWRGLRGEIRSSSYYAALPAWAAEFDASHPITGEERREWKAVYATADAPPLRVLEDDRRLDRYLASPFAVEDVFGLARLAIENEQLGRDDVPDLLILGLGAPGLLSLETGAYSPLMRDMVMRIDRQIADLLTRLEEQELLNDTAVVFTAAHGIPPQKTDIARSNLPGGSVDGDRLAAGVNSELSAFPNIRVERYVFPFVTFNAAFGVLSPDRRERIVRVAGAAAREFPGVQAYYAPEASSAVGEAHRALERGFFAGRSGHMILSYGPYYVERYGDGRGTASGSLHSYDTDVPLLFLGRWFRSAAGGDVVDATSLAPTMARLLGIASPSGSSTGSLVDALRDDDRAPIGPVAAGQP